MAQPIDFYFDFSSPYGYLGAEKIEALAGKHGRDVAWHPILLGVVFKTTGGAPLPSIPLKGEYSLRDFVRTARLHGIEFKQPTPFPISTQAPARAFCWVHGQDAVLAKRFAQALYRAYFVDGLDISVADNTVSVAARLGIDSEALRAALNDAAIKDKLKAEVDAALARGVFGSPFVIVDGEPFWGVDRFEQIDHWLATGGW
jgi:2-hydroxychromene-2-carboxylate isomerase